MKKLFVLAVIVVAILAVNVSSATDGDSALIKKADKYITKGWEERFVQRGVYYNSVGISIYAKLIYNEEKKQTKLLEQIVEKLKSK